MVDVLDERSDAPARLLKALNGSLLRVTRQSLGEYPHKGAIAGEEDAKDPIMELAVVNDIEPRQGLPRTGNSRDEADPLSIRRSCPFDRCNHRVGCAC